MIQEQCGRAAQGQCPLCPLIRQCANANFGSICARYFIADAPPARPAR